MSARMQKTVAYLEVVLVDAEVLAAAVQRRRLSRQGVPLSFEGHFRRFVLKRYI